MGDSILRAQERSWANFANGLQDLFRSRYASQSDILNFLTGKLTDMVKNPQGFSPGTMSALRGGMLDNISKQFMNARQAIAMTKAERGDSSTAPGVAQSGVDKQIDAQLDAAQAGNVAGGLDELQKTNEQLKIENQRIGLQGLSGVAAQDAPQSFAGAAEGAGSTATQAGEAYFNTDQGFMSHFVNSFGSSLGTGIGSMLSGGAGRGMNTMADKLGASSNG